MQHGRVQFVAYSGNHVRTESSAIRQRKPSGVGSQGLR